MRTRLAALAREPALRQVAVLCFDGAITAASLHLAMQLRFEGHVTEPYRVTLPAVTTLVVCCRMLANLLFRLHRWSFRFSGLADGARVPMAGLFGTTLWLSTVFLLRDPGPPRSVVVMELLLSTVFMGALRFSPRLAGLYVGDWVRSRRPGSVRTIIVGAGATGERLLRELQRSGEHRYLVVGFVDDDRSKWNHVVGGRTVLGGIDRLGTLSTRARVDEVLLAIPRSRGRRIREILTLCADCKLRFRTLPASQLSSSSPATPLMQDLSPEDLLTREPASFSVEDLTVPIARRVALVTGAAGSIGSEMCAQLLRAGLGTLVMVDLNENGLYLLGRRFEREFPEARIHLEIADIRDELRIGTILGFFRPQDVFHAAAHKHVPLMEAAPCEAVKNNVLGTRNVARAASSAGAERFLYVSSDKAVRPSSVMGATKRLGESLVRAVAAGSETRFCAVRFGNVLGSAGSVVPLFQAQIAAGGPVSVTHPDVRRYFMTTGEAVSLALQTAYGDYGELCVLDMGEPIRILDLARNMITMNGLVPEADIPIVFTGLRPGEKLTEELLTEDEERTRRVHRRISAVDCPAPPADLERSLALLCEAASLELGPRVVELLHELVPSYGPPLRESPGAAPGRPRRSRGIVGERSANA